jgi:mono/diheme cytochrome c family protein
VTFPIRRWRLSIGLGLAAVLVAIQFAPYGHARVNPPRLGEPAWDSPATRALAAQACFDCHSNETEWPAYARVAPVSWLVQHDVDEGRSAMNFSEWPRPQEHADDAAEEVRERKMPPALYQMMHPHARLSDADFGRLADGLEKTVGGRGRERGH